MRIKSIIAASGVLAILAAFLAVPAFAQAQKAASNVPICVNCHEKQNSTILLTGHGASNDASGSACQACHGDASAHLQDPVKNKPANVLGSKTASGAEKSAVCLACHSAARALENWSVAKHRKVDVSCVNCHQIHGTQSASNNKEIKGAQFAAAPYTTTARQLTYKRCIECHTDVRGEILKPSHHPIIEGKVGCQDCHEPHGSLIKASLQERLAQRSVRELPRRQARPVDPRAPAGRGELRHLPHAARVVAPRTARTEGAGALR